jgi:hypothetical protein
MLSNDFNHGKNGFDLDFSIIALYIIKKIDGRVRRNNHHE